MRMPLIQFLTGGDLKFLIAFLLFFGYIGYHFIQKLKAGKQNASPEQIAAYEARMRGGAFWILILSILYLLVGLLHGFYHIGNAGGMPPNMIFKGFSNTLITPIFGLALYIISKALSGLSSLKTKSA